MKDCTCLMILAGLAAWGGTGQTRADESELMTPHLDACGVSTGNDSAVVIDDVPGGSNNWLATEDGTTWHRVAAPISSEALFDWKIGARMKSGNPRVALTIPPDMDVGRIDAVTVVSNRTAIAAVETKAAAASSVGIPNSSGLIRTGDGGRNWEWLIAPGKFPGSTYCDYSCDALYFKTAKCGWMSGNGGLMHTTDGGVTWKTVNTPNRDATDPFFKNELEGRIIGSNTRQVYETKDGGTTWRTLTDEEVLAPSFIDYFQGTPPAEWNDYAVLRTILKTYRPEIWPGAEGIYLGPNQVLSDYRDEAIQWLATQDGKTWHRVLAPADFTYTQLWDLSVLKDGTWLASNSDPRIELSLDQGLHWSPATTNSDIVNCSDPIALAQLSQFGVLSVENGNVVTLTRPAKPKFDGFEAISILSNSTAVAIVEFETENKENPDHPISNKGIIQTTDGGKSWQRMTNTVLNSELQDCDHLFFRTLKDGWVSSDNDVGIQHTTDGGKAWRDVNIPDRIGDVMFFKSEKDGLVLGGSTDLIYETKDGGKTWRTLTDAEIEAPAFTDYFQGAPVSHWNGFAVYRMILLGLSPEARRAQLAELAQER